MFDRFGHAVQLVVRDFWCVVLVKHTTRYQVIWFVALSMSVSRVSRVQYVLYVVGRGSHCLNFLHLR